VATTIAMRNEDYDDSPEQARTNGQQQWLLPNNPRDVCERTGLNWWAAVKLGQDGFLSFDPESTPHLAEGEETELRFIGSLVVGGCDPAMLGRMVESLRKPYSYDGNRIFYDWSARRWRLLPQRIMNPEVVFAEWVKQLKDEGDADTLLNLADEIAQALTTLKSPS